jgi:hypothetical protein
MFVHESVPPSLSTPLVSFRILSKFAEIVTDQGAQPVWLTDNVPIICHRCRHHRRQIAANIVDTSGKFAIGNNTTSRTSATDVVDTGDKFSISVVDTGGAPLIANIFTNFSKKLKQPYCYFQGLGGRLFMEKNLKQKIS